jgi:hypothetical protein
MDAVTKQKGSIRFIKINLIVGIVFLGIKIDKSSYFNSNFEKILKGLIKNEFVSLVLPSSLQNNAT